MGKLEQRKVVQLSGDASRAVLTQEPVWFQVEMSRDIEGTGGCARWLSG